MAKEAENAYTTKPEGTGLGLPIAYQIINSNAGTIDIKCPHGEVQFSVYLPIYVHRSSSSRTVRRMQLLDSRNKESGEAE